MRIEEEKSVFDNVFIIDSWVCMSVHAFGFCDRENWVPSMISAIKCCFPVRSICDEQDEEVFGKLSLIIVETELKVENRIGNF